VTECLVQHAGEGPGSLCAGSLCACVVERTTVGCAAATRAAGALRKPLRVCALSR
jgi:hypothetical protein